MPANRSRFIEPALFAAMGRSYKCPYPAVGAGRAREPHPIHRARFGSRPWAAPTGAIVGMERS